MTFLFKQAAFICGRSYRLGVHEVPETTQVHPHFLKLVSAGLVVESKKTVVISLESNEERAKILLSRLLAQRPKKPAPVAEVETPAKSPWADSKSEADESGKKKKK